MITFVCNREVRIIPKGWQHPQARDGRYRPLFNADLWPETPEQQRQWMAEYEVDRPPLSEHFMPSVRGLPAQQTEIVAYSTTSEGTPISPAFPSTERGRLELVRYCVENCTTFGNHRAGVEAWAAILFGGRGAAVSADGTVYTDSPL